MRPYSALILMALLPACGLTERCSKEETKSYPSPAREDVPAIAPSILQGTLPKLEGWGSPSPKSESKTLGTEQVSSVTIVYERKNPLVAADAAAAPPGTAVSGAAAPQASATQPPGPAPSASSVPSGQSPIASAEPSAAPTSSAAARLNAPPDPNAVDPSLQRVTITILDGRYVAEAYAPFAVFMHYRGEMAEPHKRAINVAGHPGIEQWTPENGRVSVLLLVGERFLVNLEGNNLTPPEVKAWLNAIDVGQLGSWGRPTTPTATQEAH